MKHITEDAVRMRLRLHITEHFETKKNFAKHMGFSCTFVTFLTTRDKEKQKAIPDNVLEIIGVKRKVIYEVKS